LQQIPDDYDLGHYGIVKMLLETGKVNADLKYTTSVGRRYHGPLRMNMMLLSSYCATISRENL